MAGLRRGRRSRKAVLALAVPAAALLGGWAAGVFGSAPPVYDGLPLSAEPYRYLQPPPGARNRPAPASASETVTVTGASGAQTVALSTSENPPQASLIFSTGAFGGAGTRIVVKIAPVAPPAPPGRGRIDGNVYLFSATGPGPGGGTPRPVPLVPGDTVTVALRATGASGRPTLETFSSGTWHALATTHVPPSEYSTEAGGLGYFALVIPPGSAGGGGGGGALIGVVVGAVLVALGVLILLIRRARR